jgi:hypothetical protein
VSAGSLHAFESPNLPPLATVGIDIGNQCCGPLMPFWNGSGSADPRLGQDPDYVIFVNDLQDASKNKFFFLLLITVLFEGTFMSFFKEKNYKEVTKQ